MEEMTMNQQELTDGQISKKMTSEELRLEIFIKKYNTPTELNDDMRRLRSIYRKETEDEVFASIDHWANG